MVERKNSEIVTLAHPAASALDLPGIKLVVLEGPDRGVEVVARRGSVRIGTSRDNDLVLADPSVSRRHAEIRIEPSEVRIVDLGSTNGTSVDGVRVVEAHLHPACRIRVGETTLRVIALDEPIRVALSAEASFGRLLGVSASMREVFAVLERVSGTDATVVIQGETGTGKELVAEAIHERSARAGGPFVAIDCGAIAPTLVESELFGHVRGAFTGAVGDRPGVLEAANGGTLFLDEIGELPLHLQPKLLRALEKREVRRVGSTSALPIDVRIVAATNRDLALEMNRGGFREDLYFRLAVVSVTLPPLRARREDVPMLVKHFVETFAPDRVDEAPALAQLLSQRAYPGNVRELRNTVQRTLALRDPSALPLVSSQPDAPWPAELAALLELPYKEGLERLSALFEQHYLTRALARSGSISAAARFAGLSRRYVQTLLARHGLRDREE